MRNISTRKVKTFDDVNRELDNLRDILQPMEITNLVFVGSIMRSGSATTPEGYLKCDGSSVSRSLYPILFSVIGASYGASNDSMFTLPTVAGNYFIKY